MESHVEELQDDLKKALLQSLEKHIDDAITTATTRFIETTADVQNAKDIEEIAKLKIQNEDLAAQLASTKFENEMLRKNFVSLLGASPLKSRNADPQPAVPFSTHQTVVQNLETVQAQLLESIEQRKLEAAARSYLMKKMKLAKGTAQEWREYHERWVAKHSDCALPKSSRAPPTMDEIILSGEQRPASQPAAPSQGVEAFEGYFQHPTQLGESGPQDKISKPDSDPVTEVLNQVRTELRQNPEQVALHVEFNDHGPDTSNDTVTAQRTPAQRSHAAGLTSAGSTSTSRSVAERQAALLVQQAPNQPQVAPNSDGRTKNPFVSIEEVFKKPNRPVRPPVVDQDDDFEIVGERSLKRRKTGPRHSDPGGPVKQEPHSPPSPATTRMLLRVDTLDLDDTTGTVDTPRKRKLQERLHNARQRHTKRATLRHERSMSEPLEGSQPFEALVPQSGTKLGSAKRNLTRASAALQPISHNTRLLPRARHDTPTKSASPRTSTRKVQSRDRSAVQVAGSKEIRQMPVASNPTPSPVQVNRLRFQPLASLRMTDFQYNPNIDHERVAENPRANKECLPGCMDPRCCGEAMRMLAATLKPTLPRPAFPSSQEDVHLSDDEYLLKWHLGSRWDRASITMLDPGEFSELLLDARAKLLAQRYGKHKDTEHRQSPPGFWENDFPSTQVIEARKELAEKIERAKVRDRYEEALREGGRWVFRDEIPRAIKGK